MTTEKTPMQVKALSTRTTLRSRSSSCLPSLAEPTVPALRLTCFSTSQYVPSIPARSRHAAELGRNWTARTAAFEQPRNTADRRCDSNAAPVLTHALSRKDKDLMDTLIAAVAAAVTLAVVVAVAAAVTLAAALADVVTADISTRRLREGLATLVKIGDQR